jgi:uncharacterized protein
MLLDLSRLRSGVDHIERLYEPSAFPLGEADEFRLIAPVDVVADLRKDARTVRLRGRVRTGLECDCSRCLESFPVPVDATFDLLFMPASAQTAEGEREIADADLGVSFYEGDLIDLGDVIREQFYLTLPMKPLCRDDCKGLCPVCGTNWNRETCACRPAWVDPRMEPLRKLRD